MVDLGIVPGVHAPHACSVIEYSIEGSGQTLVLTQAVIDHLKRHRQSSPISREAGGQLFARFEGNTIRIERATGPRPSDRRSLMTFVPNRLAERREIKRLFKQGLHYVGDWHTHPESLPKPSQTDTDSFREMFRKSRHKLASLVIVISGTAAPPEGIFVGLYDETGWRELASGGGGPAASSAGGTNPQVLRGPDRGQQRL